MSGGHLHGVVSISTLYLVVAFVVGCRTDLVISVTSLEACKIKQ